MGAPAPGMLEELSGALASGRAAIAGFLELIALEARRAGLAFAWMVALGAAAALCAVSAWLGFMAALALWAVSLGLSPFAAAAAFASLNLIAGAALLWVCTGLSRSLLFPATRRQLSGTPPAGPAAP